MGGGGVQKMTPCLKCVEECGGWGDEVPSREAGGWGAAPAVCRGVAG